MPRVLHIGKYYPPYRGGMEQFLQVLLRALARRGVTVRALVHQHQGRSGFERDGEIGVYHSRTLGRLLFAPIAPLFLFHLFRQCRDFQPDILHLHMPNTSVFWLLLPLKLFRSCPWIVHWHSDVVFPRRSYLHRLAYRFYRPLERWVLRRATAIIVTSPPYLAHSEALRPFRDKCRVIPLASPAIALSDLPIVAKDDVSDLPGMLNVLCVGRLTHYKGQSVLLQAVAEAIKRGGAIRLVLVGSGELRAELEQQVRALGLQDSVVFAGQVDEDTLTDLYSNCDLLCLPSLERTEAFGMVLLEAMNFARPTLVTDVPGSGMSWVVRDGETGWVVKAGDASSLAERLLWCANHCEALSAAGEAGQRRAREHFSVDRVAEDTLALYREVVGQ